MSVRLRDQSSLLHKDYARIHSDLGEHVRNGKDLLEGTDHGWTGVILNELKMKSFNDVTEIYEDPDIGSSLVVVSHPDNVWSGHISRYK